jgi:hypothetical protein
VARQIITELGGELAALDGLVDAGLQR